MHKHKIGKSSVDVSPVMLGGNVFGWTADETTSFHVLDAFVDHGFNFIDTADVYSVSSLAIMVAKAKPSLVNGSLAPGRERKSFSPRRWGWR